MFVANPGSSRRDAPGNVVTKGRQAVYLPHTQPGWGSNSASSRSLEGEHVSWLFDNKKFFKKHFLSIPSISSLYVSFEKEKAEAEPLSSKGPKEACVSQV